MPIYVYKCASGHRHEVFHGMLDPGPTNCPACHVLGVVDSLVRRVILPVDVLVPKRPKSRGCVSMRSKVKGQKSGAPGVNMSFRDGYKSALARYPGDPKAYVRTKREAIKRAGELGREITFKLDDVLPND